MRHIDEEIFAFVVLNFFAWLRKFNNINMSLRCCRMATRPDPGAAQEPGSSQLQHALGGGHSWRGRSVRLYGQDHERRCPMRQEAAAGVDDPPLAGDDAPATADDAAFGADPAGVLGDRAGEIGLGLDRGVADAGGQDRLPGAAGRAVDQGQRPAAVDDPERVQKMLPGVALEDGEAVADLGRAGTRASWRSAAPATCRP